MTEANQGQNDILCCLCGKPITQPDMDHWYLDSCDICGESYCENCLVSFSPTLCKVCDAQLWMKTTEDKTDLCNFSVGRTQKALPKLRHFEMHPNQPKRSWLRRLFGK